MFAPMDRSNETLKIGRLLRAARAYHGLTATETAAQLGLHRNTIRRCEKGEFPEGEESRARMIRRLSEAVRVDDMLAEIQERNGG